jgi:choline kinase
MKAIILAAGRGERLKPLTDIAPKCLTEINGKSILKNALHILEKHGIEETIIVIGYLGEKIRENLGDKINNMKIKFVENRVYDKTNNIYSMWLTRDYLNDDTILIEGDIFFEDVVIKKLLESPYMNCAVIDHYMPLLEGCVVKLCEDGIVERIYLKSDQPHPFDYSDKFKTVNIYKLSKPLVDKLFNYIKKRICNENVNSFYEEALKDIITTEGHGSLFMKGIIAKGSKWFEIDTLQDIIIAERVFGNNEKNN